MKITKSQLNRIINEEVANVLLNEVKIPDPPPMPGWLRRMLGLGDEAVPSPGRVGRRAVSTLPTGASTESAADVLQRTQSDTEAYLARLERETSPTSTAAEPETSPTSTAAEPETSPTPTATGNPSWPWVSTYSRQDASISEPETSPSLFSRLNLFARLFPEQAPLPRWPRHGSYETLSAGENRTEWAKINQAEFENFARDMNALSPGEVEKNLQHIEWASNQTAVSRYSARMELNRLMNDVRVADPQSPAGRDAIDKLNYHHGHLFNAAFGPPTARERLHPGAREFLYRYRTEQRQAARQQARGGTSFPDTTSEPGRLSLTTGEGGLSVAEPVKTDAAAARVEAAAEEAEDVLPKRDERLYEIVNKEVDKLFMLRSKQ
jgi:hypothetical protein